jgi:hypothetical protein
MVQAKANESKYTGVSSDDMRGFGSKSAGFGSGSSASWNSAASSTSKYRSAGLGASTRSSLYDDYDEPVTSLEKVRHMHPHICAGPSSPLLSQGLAGS